MEKSDSQKKRENTAGRIGLLILTFSSISWPLLQHGIKHCHAAKSLYRVSRCIVVVCLSMLSSNTLIAFDNDRLWLFQSILTAHNSLCRAGPNTYAAWPWRHEYSVWLSTWKHGLDIPMIFCTWDYRNKEHTANWNECPVYKDKWTVPQKSKMTATHRIQ